jgi:hypothetical protein
MRKEREGLEEEGIGRRRGMEGRGGVAGVPGVGGGRHTGDSTREAEKDERLNTEDTEKSKRGEEK